LDSIIKNSCRKYTNTFKPCAAKAKQIIESRMRACREARVKSQTSCKTQAGELVDEIVKLAEEANTDLIIMASTRASSTLKTLGSTTRKAIDKAKAAVLIVHK
jgi:nucleotide-binding universal stress UspA family protein